MYETPKQTLGGPDHVVSNRMCWFMTEGLRARAGISGSRKARGPSGALSTAFGIAVAVLCPVCLAQLVEAPEGSLLQQCASAAAVWSPEREDITSERVLPQAVAICEVATREVPGDGDTWAFLARAYRSQVRYLEALEAGDKALELDSVEGLWERGVALAFGFGVDENAAEAAKRYREAADLGHAVAKYNLGWLYLNGVGVEQDALEAARWWRKAAAQGYARAQLDLGTLYYDGVFVKQDSDEASQLYRKVANRMGTHGIAQSLLVELLADYRSHVRQRVVAAMGGVGETVEALVELVEQENTQADTKALLELDKTRRNAIAALGQLGSPRAVEPLVGLLAQQDSSYRGNAAEALGRLGDPSAVEPLVTALVDDDLTHLDATAFTEALIGLGEPGVVEPLVLELLNFHHGSGRDAPEALRSLVDPKILGSVRSIGVSAVGASYTKAGLLGAIGEPQDVDALITLLDHWDSSTRRKAAQALGLLGDLRAVTPLIVVLEDDEELVRWAATQALGRLGDQRAVEPLSGRLYDEDAAVRYLSVEALRGLGGQHAVESLVALLEDSAPFLDNLRQEAAEALGAMVGSHSVKLLTARLGNEDASARARLAEGLGALSTPASIVGLIGLLEDDEERVRWRALQALKALDAARDARVIDATLAQFDDADPAVRASAAEAVGELGIGSSVEQLIVSLHDEHSGVRATAAEALGKLGGRSSVEPLIAALHDEHPGVRASAAEALGSLRDPRSVSALTSALDDQNAKVRSKAAWALGRLAGARSVGPLMATLADGEPDVRGSVVRALGALRDSRALEPLVAALADDDRYVRRQAIEALGELGDSRAIDPLLDLLTHGSLVRRWRAMEALAELDAFKTKAVQAVVATRFAASTLLPAVSYVDEYHRGMLFCVDAIAERSAYGQRLDLLQAVWRWRHLGARLGAEELAEDVRQLRSSTGSPEEVSPHTALLAAILSASDKRFAASHAWAGLGLAQAEAREVEVRIGLSVVRAEALVEMGRVAKALTVLEAVEAELASHGPMPNRGGELHFIPEAELEMAKAFVLAKLGSNREAFEAGRDAEAVLRSAWLLDRIDARLFARLMGARVAPLQQYALAAESSRYQRHSTAYFSDQSPQGVQEEYGYAVVVKAAVQEALNSGDYDRYLTAQEKAERLLLGAMVQPNGEIRFADEERRSAHGRLVALQREVADLAQRAPGESNRGEDGNLAMELRRKKAELNAFVRRLKREHPDIAARWGKAPTEVGQLQDRLDAKTGIVQYLVLDGESYAFVIHGAGVEIERLGIDGGDVGLSCPEAQTTNDCFAVERSVHRYRALLRRAGPKAPPEQAEQLVEVGGAFSAALLSPIEEHIERLDHLVLVPNGILHWLPWPALPWKGGYLIEHKSLSVLPASSMFAALAPTKVEPAGLLALGNPVPDASGWNDLPRAVEEVESLDRHFPDLAPKRILTGVDASLRAVVGQNLKGYVLHFAVHARSGRPEKARLLLTDGDLTYDEILRLDIKDAPSVVLSACETGLGEILSGDQVYSLADAFLQAQARSVLYSLWLVDDESTAILMSEFYGRYNDAEDKAAALAEAQRVMIGRGYAPGHWAGFLVSEWSGRTL